MVRALPPTVVCCLKSWAAGVVRVPGIGREKLTARTNKKKKTYAMRSVKRTLHTLQQVKLIISITYRYLNLLVTIYALIVVIKNNSNKFQKQIRERERESPTTSDNQHSQSRR